MADGLLALRWDGTRKRWEVTFTDRHGRCLARDHAETTVEVDAVVAAECVKAVRRALERMLPF
jgi:hypothetical protein